MCVGNGKASEFVPGRKKVCEFDFNEIQALSLISTGGRFEFDFDKEKGLEFDVGKKSLEFDFGKGKVLSLISARQKTCV